MLRRVKGGSRRAWERKKCLENRGFAGSRGCRVDPPVFALVDPWWTRAEGRPRPPPDRDVSDGDQTPAEQRRFKTTRRAARDVWHYEGLTAPPLSAPVSGSSPGSAGCAMARPCRSSSSRSATADGEDRSMAQTDQAWDWGVELRDEERSELELLRRTVAQLRTQLDQAHESLRSCRQRQQDASQALRQLDEARPWRRRRVRTALRERQLL